MFDSSSKLPLLERSPCWLQLLTPAKFETKFPLFWLVTLLLVGVVCTVNGDPKGVFGDTRAIFAIAVASINSP